MTYQAYTNRATFDVHVLLNNTEALHNEARRISRTERFHRWQNDQALEEWVTHTVVNLDNIQGAPVGSIASDLLSHALASVDWREITEAFRED